jgi:Protein of unknown function (DUF2934)
MDRDDLEELRERLLREENVQQMIRARAYEIYRMRGTQPGAAAGDWLQAESEVLAFLLAHESHRAVEKPSAQAAVVTSPSDVQKQAPSPKKSKSRAVSKASNAKQGERNKAATKRVASKKSPESTRKPKRTRKKQEGDDRQS